LHSLLVEKKQKKKMKKVEAQRDKTKKKGNSGIAKERRKF
jgi:hypothetical protein